MSAENEFVSWTEPAQAHKDKKIKATVRMDFIIVNERPNDFRRQLPTFLPAVVERWNGKKFKCYDFEVELDWRWANSQAEVRPNALDVFVDEGAPYGQIASRGPSQDKATSDDPADSVVPQRGSFWGSSHIPLAVNIIAHELGHVLGLDDGYATDSGFWGFFGSGERGPLAGHPPDIMQDPNYPVLPSTITRVVRRHYGLEFENQMNCPLSLTVGPARYDAFILSLEDLRLEAQAERYDPPSSDPAVVTAPTMFTGTFHVRGEYLARFPELPWAVNGDATVPVTFELGLGQDPIELRIDLGFWLLTQTLHWDYVSNLPYAKGPLVINVQGAQIDSGALWPGPALLPEFSHPVKEQP